MNRLAVAFLGGIWGAAVGYSSWQILFLPFPAFWIGGVIEIFNKGGMAGERLRRVVRLLAAFVAGPIVIVLTVMTVV